MQATLKSGDIRKASTGGNAPEVKEIEVEASTSSYTFFMERMYSKSVKSTLTY